jgi:hypothetical protein
MLFTFADGKVFIGRSLWGFGEEVMNSVKKAISLMPKLAPQICSIGHLFVMVLFYPFVFPTFSLSHTSSFASFPSAFIPSPPGSHVEMSIFTTGILSLDQQVVTEAKHVTVFLSGTDRQGWSK